MEFGTDFCVLVNDIAFFENDVAETYLDRESCSNFGGCLCRVVFGLFLIWVFCVVETVFCVEVLLDVGKVEPFPVLIDADIEGLHVDVANVQRSCKEFERVDVDAELVEPYKPRLVVCLHDGERIDVENVGERIQADVLDGDASTNHFLGVVLDVATGYLWGHEEDDKVEEDQRSEDDKENFEGLLHRIKSK